MLARGCAEPGPPLWQIIFLQTRPRQPHTAAMLSSCIDGRIYAWSLHGNGGLLGKFPVDLEDNGDVVVGAMTTDENDWILITGDCKGHIKVRNNCVEGEGLVPSDSGYPFAPGGPYLHLLPLGTGLPCKTLGGGSRVDYLGVPSCSGRATQMATQRPFQAAFLCDSCALLSCISILRQVSQVMSCLRSRLWALWGRHVSSWSQSHPSAC